MFWYGKTFTIQEMERGKFQNNGYRVHLVILLLSLTRCIIHRPCFSALLCALEAWSVGIASTGPPCCLVFGGFGQWEPQMGGWGKRSQMFLPHFLSTLLPNFWQELHWAFTVTPASKGGLLHGSRSHMVGVNLSNPFPPSSLRPVKVSAPLTLPFNLCKNFSHSVGSVELS